jgi:hypothetical protein
VHTASRVKPNGAAAKRTWSSFRFCPQIQKHQEGAPRSAQLFQRLRLVYRRRQLGQVLFDRRDGLPQVGLGVFGNSERRLTHGGSLCDATSGLRIHCKSRRRRRCLRPTSRREIRRRQRARRILTNTASSRIEEATQSIRPGRPRMNGNIRFPALERKRRSCAREVDAHAIRISEEQTLVLGQVRSHAPGARPNQTRKDRRFAP